MLELGFRMLTVLDETCGQIVLLVSGAQALQRKTLRYIQFACEAGANLRLVLAGEPGLMDVLSWEAADFLHARLGSHPVIAVEAPEPGAALPGPAVRDAAAGAVSAGLPRHGGMPQLSRVAPATSRVRWLAGAAVLWLAVVLGVAVVAFGVGADHLEGPAVGSGTAVIDDAATGAAAVTHAAPSQAAPAPAALPDRTVRADPVAPPSAAQDAAARATSPVPTSPKVTSPAPTLQATDVAPGQSANPSRMISPPGPASSPAQEPAAQEAPSAQLPPAAATAGIAAVPDRPAPPSHAAALLPDDAVAAPSLPPRVSRRGASRQADAPAREAQHDGEAPQEAPRRDMTTTLHAPARMVNLRPRAPEDRASETRTSDARDDLPLPPPFARRPHHAAPRPVPFASRLPDPELPDLEPPEPVREPEVRAQQPEGRAQPYIGTFGLDANGLRSFHPGQ